MHRGDRLFCVIATSMPSEMKSGSVLTKEGTALPESVQTEPFMKGWNLVSDADAAQTQRNVEQAGWQFLRGREIRASATARDLKQAIRRALQHLAEAADRQKVNAVEVIGFDATKLIFFFEVAARGYARQIQREARPALSDQQHEDRRIAG